MPAKYNEITVVKLYREGYSTSKLARLFEVAPTQIRRILIKHGQAIRSHSEAQKMALERDPDCHPMKGKTHRESSKAKTSEAMKKFRAKERYEKRKLEREAKKNGEKKTDGDSSS